MAEPEADEVSEPRDDDLTRLLHDLEYQEGMDMKCADKPDGAFADPVFPLGTPPRRHRTMGGGEGQEEGQDEEQGEDEEQDEDEEEDEGEEGEESCGDPDGHTDTENEGDEEGDGNGGWWCKQTHRSGALDFYRLSHPTFGKVWFEVGPGHKLRAPVMDGLTEAEVVKADNAILYFIDTERKVWLENQNQPSDGYSSSHSSDLVCLSS